MWRAFLCVGLDFGPTAGHWKRWVVKGCKLILELLKRETGDAFGWLLRVAQALTFDAVAFGTGRGGAVGNSPLD
ncbi:hypothetical protein CAQU_08620 [Corynebacterium aquilae DSM 44791]|uniref:Uncharacterized protein n=1 Tax=Corynebacterium aquilae DSM 44791 TaxID=1431546 RepID=A0A1L7CHA2_9CORY|nr:hypothetical protein CAQU_08620 [Corynebacterium aquilae DSM 44791]